MAQDPKGENDRRAKRRRRNGPIQDVLDSRAWAGEQSKLIDFMSDPMSEFFPDNFALLAADPWLSSIINQLSDKLLAKGFVFQLEDGTICYPNSDFKSIIDAYWHDFFRRAIRFICCKGYLVWARGVNSTGIEFPFVPDWAQLRCSVKYDDTTGAPLITAAWASDNERMPQLYVCHQMLHTGISPGFTCSIIDSIKPRLFFLYQIERSRILTFQRIAQPDIVLQVPAPRPTASAGNADLQGLGVVQEFLAHGEDTYDDDEVAYERVQRARMMGNWRAPNAAQMMMTMPPWAQTRIDMTQPIEERYHHVPHGMVAQTQTAAASDLEFYNIWKQLRAEILYAFGMTSGTGLVADTEKNQSKESSAGFAGASPDGDTIYMWKETIMRIATSVFRILYHNNNLQIADARPTYAEQWRKRRAPNDHMDVEDLFAGPGEPGSTAPAGAVIRKEEGEGGKSSSSQGGKPPSPPGGKTSSPNDHDGEERGSGGGGSAPSGPKIRKGEKLGDYLKRTNVPIKMLLMSHLLAHRDTAKQLMEQGGILEETYYELHPPVNMESADKKKDEQEKEKLQKEIDKLKEEKEKAKTKAEMDKIRDSIKDLKESMSAAKSSSK